MFRLETLGGLRMAGDGGEVLPGRRKELALLAYLGARAPRPVARDELATLLWEDREDSRARHSLRQALSVLRPLLGDGLGVSASAVRLAAGAIEVDAAAFAADVAAGRLAEAVARWQGDFLAGLDDLGGESWRAWLEAEREALRRQLEWALSRLLDNAERRAAWGEVAAWARRWMDLLPPDERPVRHLVEALHRQGRTGEALACHAHFVARLRQDLGTPPSADYLRAVSVIDASGSVGPTPGSAALFTPDLVGRAGVMAELLEAWHDARTGPAAVVVMEGEEGIGRTRVCEEFLRRLEDEGDVLVLRARGAAEAAGEWRAARDLFAGLRYAPGLPGASDRALAEISRLVPGLHERFPRLPETTGDPARLAPALAEVLGDVAAEIPVVLFVDDFTQADDASQQLLLSLARALRAPGILLLLVADVGDSRAPLAALRSVRRMRRLRPASLGTEETEALIASMLACVPDERARLAQLVCDASGGNPLFITEILASLVDDGRIRPDASGCWQMTDPVHALPIPPSVSEALRRRVHRLSPGARALLAVATRLPEPIAAARFASAGELAHVDIGAALDELVGRRLLRESPGSGGSYELVHALLRVVARDPDHAGGSAGVRDDATARGRTRRRRAVLLGVGTMAAALGVAMFAIWSGGRRAAGGEAPLAVGSIRDYSGLADAVALPEMLATNLARVPGLNMVSRARLYELVGHLGMEEASAAALAAAARRAGAGTVLEGELYRREGGVLRLDLRRVRVRDGVVQGVWSVEARDLFALVDGATERVAAGMGHSPGALRVAEVTTASLVAHRLYEEGLRAYYQSDVSSARRLFRAALAEDSTYAMAAYYARLAERALELPADAALEGRLLRLADRAPDRERLLIRGAWAQLANDPMLLAVAETLEIRYPAEPDGHLLLGNALAGSGDFLAAVPHLRRVITMDSLGLHGTTPLCRACEAFQGIAGAYMHADSFPAAERTAREWVRAQPASGRAWQLLADVLEGEGYREEADAAGRRAVAILPGIPFLQLHAATTSIRAGDFAAADRLLREMQPALPLDARWFLTISLRNQGRLRDALEVARAIRRIDTAGGDAPGAGSATVRAPAASATAEAQVLFEMQRFAQAAALFDSLANAPGAVLSRAPGSQARWRAWMLTHAAVARAAAGDTMGLRARADTIERLGARSSFGRDRRLHHHVRGLLHAARGDTAAALAELRRAIYSTTYGYTRTNLELGRLLLATERPREAIRILRPALRGPLEASNFYVTHAELHELLGHAFQATGQADSARAHLRWGPRSR